TSAASPETDRYRRRTSGRSLSRTASRLRTTTAPARANDSSHTSSVARARWLLGAALSRPVRWRSTRSTSWRSGAARGRPPGAAPSRQHRTFSTLAHHRLPGRPTVGAEPTQDVDRLEQVRLPLAVAAHHKVQPRAELDTCLGVVAEVREDQAPELQPLPREP